MSPAEMRRQHRAARSLAHAQRLEARSAEASAILTRALGDADRATVPGYTVVRDAAGLRVAPLPRIDASQLPLWSHDR